LATTELGNSLTEAHRLRQVAVRALLVQQIVAIWPLFDVRNIDESWPQVETALLAAITQGRAMSSTVARGYYEAFRVAEDVPEAPIDAPRLAEDWKAAAVVSLHVTGPATAKRAIAANRADAKAQSLVTLSGAASRITLDAGRQTLQAYVEKDSQALGYARVSSRKPCGFCAMLIARGAVYSKSRGNFRAHDHCSCSLEPVFRRGQSLPPSTQAVRKLWDETTSGTKGAESVAAFRKAFESAP
jgi:hypothetical protein